MKGKSLVSFLARSRREGFVSKPVGVEDLNAFFFELRREEWSALMGKFEARAKFLREGGKGKIITDQARKYLLSEFRNNKKGDVAFICVIIALLRVAKVNAVRKDLIEMIQTLSGPNCEQVGMFAAHALWEFGFRAKLIAPYISKILGTEMTRQADILMVFFQRN